MPGKYRLVSRFQNPPQKNLPFNPLGDTNKIGFFTDQELISIEGEDGIIYQMIPEQQQMLINNGTFRVDSRVIQDEVRNSMSDQLLHHHHHHHHHLHHQEHHICILIHGILISEHS